MPLSLDKEGHITKISDWNCQVALELAKLENIELTAAHWELIETVRLFFFEFEHVPSIRPLSKWIQISLDPEKSGSIYLHKLFPNSPARQLARIAGLPKPAKCL